MRWRVLGAVLLLAAASVAQVPETGAMLGLSQTFTAYNTFTSGVELGGVTTSQLATLAGNVNIVYVSDGTPNSSPCTGSGSGAWAFYVGSQWNCSALTFSA